jgi:hypothetical protein
MSFDLGDPVVLTYPSKPASPATVTVTITQPDGTVSGPTSAMSGSLTFTPTQSGRHAVKWASTGPADAYTDAFDVDPADPGYVISLQDAKTMLKKTSTTDDDDLRLYLSAVTSVVETIVGPILSQTHTEIHRASDKIVLDYSPAQSLVSVALTDTTLPSTYIGTYVLEQTTGILRRQGAYAYEPAFAFQREPLYWYDGFDLTITYTAGRTAVPAGVQVAARMILADSWATRRGAMPLPPRGGDEYAQADGVDIVISQQAKDYLAPFASRGPRIA